RAMLRIAFGETRSYGELAQAIGKPKAVRAVGGACGANPIPVIVPCHRVLAANQKLGGFSAGLHWKLKLLGIEGFNRGRFLPGFASDFAADGQHEQTTNKSKRSHEIKIVTPT